MRTQTIRRLVLGTVATGTLLATTVVAAEARPSVYWTDQIGTSGDDRATGVATARNGDVYVYGDTEGAMQTGFTPLGNRDVYLARYNKYGDLLWVRQFGTAGDEVPMQRIVVTSAGDVIIGGATNGAWTGYTNAGGYDAFVAKVSKTGVLKWVRQSGSAGYDAVVGAAAASSGDLYFSVQTNGVFPSGTTVANTSGGGYDAVLAKFDRNGRLKWAKQLGGPGDETTWDVAVSRRNEVYLAGTTFGDIDDTGPISLGGVSDGFIARYDAKGNQTWLKTFGGAEDDEIWGVAVNRAGEVYAAGDTTGSRGTVGPEASRTNQGQYDSWIVKMDKLGTVAWESQHGTAGNDYAWSPVIAKNGKLLVGGGTQGSLTPNANLGGWDTYVASVSTDGVTTTIRQFSTAEDDYNGSYGTPIALGTGSSIVLAGLTSGSIWGHHNEGSDDAFVTAIPGL